MQKVIIIPTSFLVILGINQMSGKDRKKIQIDPKDQNDPKRIHARSAVPTAPRRQGRRTSFGTFVFVLCDSA
ncbi:hypothetical protein RCS94_00285 [Orbaceae bacterium ac157xtp]